MFVPPAGRRPQNCIFVGAQNADLKKTISHVRASSGSSTSKLHLFGAQIAPKTRYNSKYERVTAPKSESSRRDMQNRLILVSNGGNFDMFTTVQRSACRPHLQECLSP